MSLHTSPFWKEKKIVYFYILKNFKTDSIISHYNIDSKTYNFEHKGTLECAGLQKEATRYAAVGLYLHCIALTIVSL